MGIVLGVAAFVVVLFSLTFASAFIADITGAFRLLFVQNPYRRAFRVLRWLLAAAAATVAVLAIE